jgi:peroxiredoxin
MVDSTRRSFPILLATGLLLSVTLNVALSIRHRQLKAHYGLVKALTRLPQAGMQYPAFDGVTATGDRVMIGEAPPGTRQLIFVLTSTCPYCAETIPVWRALADEFRRDSTGTLAIYALVTDSVETTQQYLDALEFPVTAVGFPDRRTLKLARATQVPQTLLVDDDGWIRYAHMGLFRNQTAVDSVRRAVHSPMAVTPVVGTLPEGSLP